MTKLSFPKSSKRGKDYYYSEYVNRIKDSVSETSSIGRLSYWLEKHTTLHGRPFSFKGHEYGRAIADSTHPDNAVKKPSQTGLTELAVRIILAFLNVERDSCGMALWPTLSDAQRMAKTRIDTVVAGSAALKNNLKPGTDSSSLKQFGTSQLVLGGTYGREIISVPVDFLMLDEYNFCDHTNALTAESRLSHSRFVTEIDGVEIHGITWRYSTPTGVGKGVDALFEKSDKKYRLVRCFSCSHWFWPSFFENVVIDGWDRALSDLTLVDALVLEEKGLLPTARILCPKCGKHISKEYLGPEFREWVAESPRIKGISGFQVSPFDVPDYNTPPIIFKRFINYEGKWSKFKNYVLGSAHSDASNSFLAEVIEKCELIQWVKPAQARPCGAIAGLDIGLTSWLIIGTINPMTGLPQVIHLEQIRLGADGSGLMTTVLERMKQYGVTLLVCDMQPYTDSVLKIQAARPPGWVLPNTYSLPDTQPELFNVVETGSHMVKSHRTRVYDSLSQLVNNGSILFPLGHPEMPILRKHAKNYSKIEPEGEEPRWVNEGPDHYIHALGYLYLASLIKKGKTSVGVAPPPRIVQVTVGGKYRPSTDRLPDGYR